MVTGDASLFPKMDPGMRHMLMNVVGIKMFCKFFAGPKTPNGSNPDNVLNALMAHFIVFSGSLTSFNSENFSKLREEFVNLLNHVIETCDLPKQMMVPNSGLGSLESIVAHAHFLFELLSNPQLMMTLQNTYKACKLLLCAFNNSAVRDEPNQWCGGRIVVVPRRVGCCLDCRGDLESDVFGVYADKLFNQDECQSLWVFRRLGDGQPPNEFIEQFLDNFSHVNSCEEMAAHLGDTTRNPILACIQLLHFRTETKDAFDEDPLSIQIGMESRLSVLCASAHKCEPKYDEDSKGVECLRQEKSGAQEMCTKNTQM